MARKPRARSGKSSDSANKNRGDRMSGIPQPTQYTPASSDPNFPQSTSASHLSGSPPAIGALRSNSGHHIDGANFWRPVVITLSIVMIVAIATVYGPIRIFRLFSPETRSFLNEAIMVASVIFAGLSITLMFSHSKK